MKKTILHNYGYKFYWTIRSYPSGSPATGPYYAQIVEELIS